MHLLASAKHRGRLLYQAFAQLPIFRLRNVDILADPTDSLTAERFVSLMTDDRPLFVARIGGSDYSAVQAHYNDARTFTYPAAYVAAVERVQEYNGYFDFDHDPANFTRYLEDLDAFYVRAECLLYAGPDLIPAFRTNRFALTDVRFLNHLCRGKTAIDYTFVELVMPFLESFKVWGEGRRILIVSPFSRSLEAQYQRLNDLLVGYEFPQFELVTYTSPVTYALSDDTNETLGVSSRNWHEQCQLMTDEIRELDFDIALLSCASYSMFLGDFISRDMEKKAVYLGGILNVLFNIYGERYDTPFFNGIMRAESQIEAIENDDLSSLRAGKGRANEALRAYFGKRG